MRKTNRCLPFGLTLLAQVTLSVAFAGIADQAASQITERARIDPRVLERARIDPKVLERVRVIRRLPLEVRITIPPSTAGAPTHYVKRPSPINAGLVPPNFVHTWGIDVTAPPPPEDQAQPRISLLRLGTDLASVALNWASGDRVRVLASNGSLTHFVDGKPAEFTSLQDVKNKTVVVYHTDLDAGKGHTRFYLLLATSEAPSPRRFELTDVLLYADPRVATSEALLLTDDLNYETTFKGDNCPLGGCPVPFFELPDGTTIDHPWRADGRQTPKSPQNGDKPIEFPAASKNDGWYLIGRNTTRCSQPGFCTLLYYNERTSILRVYLLNVNLPSDRVVGYSVRLRLWAGGKNLDGLFFIGDPRPQRWREALVIIPASVWANDKWAFFEVTMLYPMARELPWREPSPEQRKESRLFPVYETAHGKKDQNVQLQVEVRPFLEGDLKADLVAEAIGQAIEDSGGSRDVWYYLINQSNK